MKFAVFLRCTPARAAAALFFLLVGSLGQRATAQTVVENPTANQAILQPTTPSLTTLSVNNFNRIFYVDGTKYAASIAGINQAVSDASASGGKVIVPSGIYTVVLR